MKRKIVIKKNTDLNELIEKINLGNQAVKLDEETLMFPDWIYELLPSPFKQIGSCFDKPRKRDMALISVLVIQSAVNKKLQTLYGDTFKGTQLFGYILGNPAMGKGLVSMFRQTGEKVHDELLAKYNEALEEYNSKMEFYDSDKEAYKKAYPDEVKPVKPPKKCLFLPANTSKTKLASALFQNDGNALIYESEADTLQNANKSDFGGFSDILRKGTEGEPISVDRVYFNEQSIDIKKSNISVLLTSTLNQLFRLLPNSDDGLKSRILFYLLPANTKYESQQSSKNFDKINKMLNEISELFLEIHKWEESLEDQIIFSFTEIQKQKIDELFSSLDEAVEEKEQYVLKSSLFRLAPMFYKLAMLISFVRVFRENKNFTKLVCSDIDFQIVYGIITKLVHHLQLLEYLYDKKNKKHFYSSMIPKTTDDKKREAAIKKLQVVDLFKDGLSSRKISEAIFGNYKHSGTVIKWLHEYKSGKLLPLPEAEAQRAFSEFIEVKSMLEIAKVSFFKNLHTSEPMDIDSNLFEAMTSSKYEQKVRELRNTINQEERQKLKESFFAFTPSGTFYRQRKKENLIKHSTFICIDIDEKDNTHIFNFDELKDELSNIVNIAFVSKSVSGFGYCALIPIKDEKLHTEYFDALLKAFEQLGIIIDKQCRDVTRLRIVTFDERYYMSEKAIVFNKLIESTETISDIVPSNPTDATRKFFKLYKIIGETERDITNGYHSWFTIGSALANKFGEDGRNYFHSISKFYPKYKVEETNKQFDYCLKREIQERSYGFASIFRVARENGIAI